MIITGTITNWGFYLSFFDNGDTEKLLEISSWGSPDFGLTSGQFRGCSHLTISATDSPGMTGTLSLRYAFQDAAAFNQDISAWNTGSVTTMSYMFDNAASFDQNLGAWNITKGATMNYIFRDITLSTPSYDGILIGWESQDIRSGILLTAGNSEYSAGPAAAARQALIDDHGWVIMDGGQAP